MDLSKIPANPSLMMSGGLDSTILAHLLAQEGIRFTGIFMDYGQRNALNSRRVVNRTARALSIPLEVISIPGLASSFVGNMDDDYDDYAVILCEVHEGPFSFIPIITIASGLAVSFGSNALLLGYNKSDRDSEEDRYRNTHLIAGHISEMFSIDRTPKFEVLTPLWDLPKHSVIEMGIRSNIPIEETWSCWDSKPRHCGKCPGCEDRITAFAQLSTGDPTNYY